MRRRLGIVLLLVAWLGSNFWLLRYEAFPEFFTRAVRGYPGLLSDSLLVADNWYIVRFHDAPIGYSHTWVDLREDNPLEHIAIESETILQLSILGERQRLSVFTEAYLDLNQRLHRFRFGTRAESYSTLIEGRRTEGTRFDVRIRTGGSDSRLTMDIPEDVVLYSPVTDLALRRMRPGDRMQIRTLNPLTQSVVPVTVEALRAETLRLGTNVYEAVALAITTQGLTVQSWIDADGALLRQETDLGWTLERSSFEEAMELTREAADLPDILRATAVQLDGAIPHPRASTRLLARLRGATLDPHALTGPRQRVLASGGTDTLLEILDGRAAAGQPGWATNAADVAATPFLQAQDPRIVRQARELAAERTDPAETALAISRWVDRAVANVPRASLPSALDVLLRREGDCNEHTYLAVALARAVGIPARITVGIVCHEGAFYYHAWPAFHVGAAGWLETDPTFGQDRVDATHIALLQGELQSQAELTRVFGRLRVEVVEVDDATTEPESEAP